MKSFFSTIVFVISAQSYALPVPPIFEGHYKFTGILNTVNTLKKEIVYVSTAEGRKRLEVLKEMAFTCTPVFSTTYSCAKNTNDPIPKDIQDKLTKNLNENSIEMSTPLSEWGLVSTAEYLTEFLMQQKTQIGNQIYYKSRYLVTPDIQKFVLQSENESVWFNVYAGKLHMAIVTSKTTGKNTFENYLIEARFETENQ